LSVLFDFRVGISWVQRKLELSLSLTIDWLKFEKNKNSMLVGANGAAIFGIVTLTGGESSLNLMYLRKDRAFTTHNTSAHVFLGEMCRLPLPMRYNFFGFRMINWAEA
jgi:hypothetical protein